MASNLETLRKDYRTLREEGKRLGFTNFDAVVEREMQNGSIPRTPILFCHTAFLIVKDRIRIRTDDYYKSHKLIGELEKKLDVDNWPSIYAIEY